MEQTPLLVQNEDGTTSTARVLYARPTPTPADDRHDYQDALCSHPKHHLHWLMRTKAEVDALPKNIPSPVEIPVEFDPVAEATLQTVDAWRTHSGEPQQVWLPLKIPANTAFTVVWDQMWSEGWRFFPDENPNPLKSYIHTEKSYRFDIKPGPKDPVTGKPEWSGIWLAPKHFYSGSDGPYNEGVGPTNPNCPPGALYSFRFCNSSGAQFALGDTVVTSEHIGPIAETYYGFALREMRTIVHWSNNQLSVWMGDTTQGWKPRLVKRGWRFPGDMHTLRLEDDISAPGGDAINPVSRHWTWGVVCLLNITYDETVNDVLSLEGLR